MENYELLEQLRSLNAGITISDMIHLSG